MKTAMYVFGSLALIALGVGNLNSFLFYSVVTLVLFIIYKTKVSKKVGENVQKEERSEEK